MRDDKMIRRLKLRFTGISMLVVSIVLVFFLAGIFYSNYRQSREATNRALQRAMMNPDDTQKLPEIGNGPSPSDGSEAVSPEDLPSDTAPADEGNGGDKHLPQKDESFIPVIVVEVAKDGTMTTKYAQATISEENLSSAVALVQAAGSDSGLLRSLSLRYLRRTMDDGMTRIALASNSLETSQMKSLLMSSLMVGIPALVALFLICYWLSSLSVRPVKRSLMQQKQFIADASHELKTPLTVILANNNILMDHPDETIRDEMKWIQSTQDESTRMKKLIENLLFLAKNDAGRQVVTLMKTNLSDLVEGCALTFESVAFERGHALESEVEPDLTASCDEAQMKQLVLILLDNACKYSKEGGSVTLSLHRAGSSSSHGSSGRGSSSRGSHNSRTALLSVHNDGDPIPPEAIPHLFERFYRVDDSRDRSHGGYGLGLAIAATIADTHHGKISVTSTKEEGTTFTVTLPLL